MSSKKPHLTEIGEKVSIRLHDPEGGFRDLLGILESETSVRKRSGQLVEFDPGQIVIWKKVDTSHQLAGQGSPLSLRIRELELAAAATWPPTHERQLGEWTLRASGKFTMRANSVLVLGDPGVPMAEALKITREFYAEHGLPPIFHIPLPTHQDFDAFLEEEGWTKKTVALVMVADIDQENLKEPSASIVSEGWQVSDTFDQEWISVQNDQGVAEIMRSAPALYASLRIDKKIVAVGRAAIYGEWATLTRLFVGKEYRGQGYGRELVRRLLESASREGATKVLLQVDVNNLGAIHLYESIGFRRHHTYSYRVLESHILNADSGDSC